MGIYVKQAHSLNKVKTNLNLNKKVF